MRLKQDTIKQSTGHSGEYLAGQILGTTKFGATVQFRQQGHCTEAIGLLIIETISSNSDVTRATFGSSRGGSTASFGCDPAHYQVGARFLQRHQLQGCRQTRTLARNGVRGRDSH